MINCQILFFSLDKEIRGDGSRSSKECVSVFEEVCDDVEKFAKRDGRNFETQGVLTVHPSKRMKKCQYYILDFSFLSCVIFYFPHFYL